MSTLSYSSNYTDTPLHSILCSNVTDFYPEKDNESLRLFYIGNADEPVPLFFPYFKDALRASDFTEAINYIEVVHLYNQITPDVIIIDIPLNQTELFEFCTYLKKEKLLLQTPIIYNEKRLNPLQILSLKEMKLIDDIFDTNSTNINYNRKILFLKKIIWQQEKNVTKKVLKSERINMNVSISFKRIVDIVLSSIAILISLPIFILVAIAIKLESRGPIFYAAQRAGRGFKIFKFYKFRSMIVDADKKINSLSHLNQYNSSDTGPVFFKIDNDPRVTRIGRFLRNTSLDELPQLFNVLIGDMSLVGNRPLPIYEAVTLTTNDFVDRFAAPAGITGLWQVKKRGKAEMSIEERVNLDIHYSKSYNIFYDFKIMAMTPIALFQKNDV